MFLMLAVAFILLYFCFLTPRKKRIDVYITTMLVWCGLLYVKTEVLSLLNRANRLSFILFWFFVTMFLMVWIALKKISLIKNEFKSMKRIILKNKFWGLFSGIMLILAFLTVPYNWDSMTYHLSRVVNWAQNQSVAHYATNCVRQVASPPLHELICLDLYLLSGNRDALLNMVQCVSFLTNAWLVYEITFKLAYRGGGTSKSDWCFAILFHADCFWRGVDNTE